MTIIERLKDLKVKLVLQKVWRRLRVGTPDSMGSPLPWIIWDVRKTADCTLDGSRKGIRPLRAESRLLAYLTIVLANMALNDEPIASGAFRNYRHSHTRDLKGQVMRYFELMQRHRMFEPWVEDRLTCPGLPSDNIVVRTLVSRL